MTGPEVDAALRARIAELEAEQGRRVREATTLTRETGILRTRTADLKQQTDGLVVQLETEMLRQAARAEAAEARADRARTDLAWKIRQTLAIDTPGSLHERDQRIWESGRNAVAGTVLRILDAAGPPVLNLFEPNDGPLLRISETMFGRDLLTLDVHDGRLVAEYDPADLNEAAQMFADELARIGQAVVTGRTLAIIGPDLAPPARDEVVPCLVECFAPHPGDGHLMEWDCRLPEGHDGDHGEGNYRWPTGGPVREIPNTKEAVQP